MSTKKSRVERVVFFSKEDLAWRHMLEKAELLLDNCPDFSSSELNTLLEFYHIKQYFDHGIFLERWSDDQKSRYAAAVGSAFSETRKYFLKLEANSLQKDIENLDYDDNRNFWYLFSYFETFKTIDGKIFSKILESFPIQIRQILKFKQLVQHYNNEVRSFLLNYIESAELLLSHYEEKHTGEERGYTFPRSLSDTDVHSIIANYLDSEEPNLNYVELTKNSKHLKLPPKILLKAKQVAELITDKFLTEENSTKYSVEVTLDMNQVEPVIYENVGVDTKVTYGGAFFDTLTVDIQLFNVFSNIFLYTNEEELIELVNKDSEVDNFEKTFMRSRNEYYTGWTFSRKNMLAILQLELFGVYMVNKGRTLEQLINNFVQLFFREKFKLTNLAFTIPESNGSPSDRIRLTAPELEYLFKQYTNYVQEGAINHELLQIESSPVYYSEVPSMVSKKYIFSNHETVRKLQHYFFERYNILTETDAQRTSKNLFLTLITEKILKSELETYKRNYVEHLEKEGFLKISDIGVIEVTDPMQVHIAGLLHKNGSLSYWRHPSWLRSKIDQMLHDGILESSEKLFTSDETRYINYYLNKKEFTNGLDLRNKYLHGSNNRTLEVQKADYRYFLMTVILMLLKLKDDMELHEAITGG